MTEQAAAPPAPQSAANAIIWGLISTVLLFGWIWWQMGWLWAVAAVVGVFVHEIGHVLAINALGCGPGRLYIVPFLGGAATSRIPPPTEIKGVLIALAGPVFGLLAIAPFIAAAVYTGQPRWLDGALVVAFINLLQLAPAPPLDGSKAFGPALAWIHPWLERAALILVGGLAVLWALDNGSYIFAIFIALGVFGAFQRGRMRPAARRLSLGEWLATLALYGATLLLCAGAFYATLHGPSLVRLGG